MGKILITLLVTATFLITGCEAFKSSYDPAPLPEGGAVESGGAEVPEGGNGGEVETGTPEAGAPEDEAVDYSVDTTECDTNDSVSVSVTSDEAVNDGWTTAAGEDYTVTAAKVGDFSATVTIQTEEGGLSFMIKQTGDDSFKVCSVLYESCPANGCVGAMHLWSDVLTGSVEIYKFNDEDVNAGGYMFEFGTSYQGDPGVRLEGGYSADELED